MTERYIQVDRSTQIIIQPVHRLLAYLANNVPPAMVAGVLSEKPSALGEALAITYYYPEVIWQRGKEKSIRRALRPEEIKRAYPTIIDYFTDDKLNQILPNDTMLKDMVEERKRQLTQSPEQLIEQSDIEVLLRVLSEEIISREFSPEGYRRILELHRFYQAVFDLVEAKQLRIDTCQEFDNLVNLGQGILIRRKPYEIDASQVDTAYKSAHPVGEEDYHGRVAQAISLNRLIHALTHAGEKESERLEDLRQSLKIALAAIYRLYPLHFKELKVLFGVEDLTFRLGSRWIRGPGDPELTRGGADDFTSSYER